MNSVALFMILMCGFLLVVCEGGRGRHRWYNSEKFRNRSRTADREEFRHNYQDEKYKDEYHTRASLRSDNNDDSGLSLDFIILIAVGGAILLIGIIVMLAILFVRSRRRNERHSRVVEARETKEHPYWIKDNKQSDQYTAPPPSIPDTSENIPDKGVPPPTYTYALRDGARYQTIPSELGAEIQGN